MHTLLRKGTSNQMGQLVYAKDRHVYSIGNMYSTSMMIGGAQLSHEDEMWRTIEDLKCGHIQAFFWNSG